MKNDGTYFIEVWDGKIHKEYPPDVYSFKWNGIDLFVHKVYDSTDLFDFSEKYYQVSEKSTGRSLLLENVQTIKEAQKIATDKLERNGLDKVKETITRLVKEGQQPK